MSKKIPAHARGYEIKYTIKSVKSVPKNTSTPNGVFYYRWRNR